MAARYVASTVKKTLLTSFEPTETYQLVAGDGRALTDDTIFYGDGGTRSVRLTMPPFGISASGPSVSQSFSTTFNLSAADGILFYIRAEDDATATALMNGSPPEHLGSLTVRLSDPQNQIAAYYGDALTKIRPRVWENVFIPMSLIVPAATFQPQNVRGLVLGIQPVDAFHAGPLESLACNVDAVYAVYFHAAQID